MADRILPFDTTVAGNVSVDVDSTQALRIRAIGTDRSSSITPEINGDDLGAIVDTVADIHWLGANEQGPLELGDLYYYAPPDSTFELNGASGDIVRLRGERVDGVAGRFEAGADETRFNEQGEYHWTFEEGSVDIAEAITDGQVETMHTIAPATDETVTVSGLQMAEFTTSSFTTAEDQFDVLWEMDGQRWPGQFNDDTMLSVDILNMPRPPTDTTEQRGFSWDLFDTSADPLMVAPDRELEIQVRNTSGGSIGTGGNTATATFTAGVIFDERG